MNCWSLPKLRDYLTEQKNVGSISLSWLRELQRPPAAKTTDPFPAKVRHDMFIRQPKPWPHYRSGQRGFGASGCRHVRDSIGPIAPAAFPADRGQRLSLAAVLSLRMTSAIITFIARTAAETEISVASRLLAGLRPLRRR